MFHQKQNINKKKIIFFTKELEPNKNSGVEKVQRMKFF